MPIGPADLDLSTAGLHARGLSPGEMASLSGTVAKRLAEHERLGLTPHADRESATHYGRSGADRKLPPVPVIPWSEGSGGAKPGSPGLPGRPGGRNAHYFRVDSAWRRDNLNRTKDAARGLRIRATSVFAETASTGWATPAAAIDAQGVRALAGGTSVPLRGACIRDAV